MCVCVYLYSFFLDKMSDIDIILIKKINRRYYSNLQKIKTKICHLSKL